MLLSIEYKANLMAVLAAFDLTPQPIVTDVKVSAFAIVKILPRLAGIVPHIPSSVIVVTLSIDITLSVTAKL